MKFILDENLPYLLINSLKSIGHPTIHIRNTELKGQPDKKIAEFAKKQKAILITKDLEFGSTLIYKINSHYGLIITRFPNYFNAEQITSNVINFIKSININELVGSIVILELGKYRIREP